jgi:hypothetical protein
MTMNNTNSSLFLVSLIISFLQMGILAFSITLFVIHRKRIKEFYKLGLVLGTVCFAFNLPVLLVLVSSLDYQAMLPAGSGLGPGMAEIIRAVMLVVSVISSIIGIGILMFHYVIGAVEWGAVQKPRPFPVLMRTGEKAWGRIGIAALVGAGSAVVSMVIGKLLNVKEGVIFQLQKEMLKSFETLPEAVQFILLLLLDPARSRAVHPASPVRRFRLHLGGDPLSRRPARLFDALE